MKVRFANFRGKKPKPLSLEGLHLDLTARGEDAHEVLVNFRNQIAGKITWVVERLFPQAKQIKEALDVDGKGDWSEQEFIEAVIGKVYNDQLRPQDAPRLPIPTTAEGCIEALAGVQCAMILEE